MNINAMEREYAFAPRWQVGEPPGQGLPDDSRDGVGRYGCAPTVLTAATV
jgi:hypothetical protein